ncbi:winged helix-turn-helix domain-containing protein [Halobacteriales archaeon SW_8_65_20]|nr:MAG: winged helix-turn-helix domain-containing protein [Halobacteriales archaeon QH_7_65_31]PSQ53301.1 MAG: winged helix-turn-helix domain-containing protein [Halobacteriales archaeon SW_8_65_20]
MRLSADWMTIADDRLLEYIAKHETATPTEMAESDLVRFKRVHLQRRCQKLYQYGLVRQVGNGVYMLSEQGQQYLDGELDAAELKPDEN